MINGLDMKDLIEKAKDMQKNLAKKKEEAASKKVDVSVGGGMVQILMNGNLETLSVKIDPEIIDKDEVETLEDLIRAAVNESIKQAKELVSSEMTDMLSGMNLPDFGDLLK